MRNGGDQLDDGGAQDIRGIIPQRSFGNCRWCAAQDVRLSYLMCGDCFRIAEMIPSKTRMLIGRPNVRKRLGRDITIKTVAAELREFLLDPKNRFPAEQSQQTHWEKMVSQVRSEVSPADISRCVAGLIERGIEELPSQSDLAKLAAVDRLLRFMLHISVLRDLLRIELDQEDAACCCICGRPAAQGSKALCSQCRSEILRQSGQEEVQQERPKPYMGMKAIDIIMKDRGRR
ncbi:MAG TPA: hypothetical protein PLQ35_11835 [bacterium]|nr:hypothetical protein [bacterium]HQL62975.1 hypothetical protein [bacterium]